MSQSATEQARWAERRVLAAALRFFVMLVPLACSVVFVWVASRILARPAGSLLLFVGWWAVLSAVATAVLFGVDRVVRRLLPLAALLKLSLVFPDQAPSRFRIALRAGTVRQLEQNIADGSSAAGDTPVAAAERLLALVASLNAHDRGTRGHSERVRAYTQMIAEEMNLPPHEVELLHWAALLHDVGKLEVPREILAKPGKPTSEEWEALLRHPQDGEALIEPLRPWLGEFADAVGQHHERWDGEGYPRGLRGTDISLAARIVCVADTFDVITSVRSYKKSLGTEFARQELADGAGTQFDSRVVRAFLGLSVGRLRSVMGPLAWLAFAPVLARIPVVAASGPIAGAAAATAGVLTFGGLLGGPPASATPESDAAPAVASIVATTTTPAAATAPRATSTTAPPRGADEEIGDEPETENDAPPIASPDQPADPSEPDANPTPIAEPAPSPTAPAPGDIANPDEPADPAENDASPTPIAEPAPPPPAPIGNGIAVPESPDGNDSDLRTVRLAPDQGFASYKLIGGSVTVGFAPGKLTLVAATPADGFVVEVTQEDSDRIEVRFRSKDHESRVEVRLDGSELEERLRETPTP